MPEKSCTDCYEPDLMKCAACARNPKGVENDPVEKTMPDIKEKLVELLVDFNLDTNNHICDGCGTRPVSESCVEIADYLIANGVTIQPQDHIREDTKMVGWISVEERLPTKEDADGNECVLAEHKVYGGVRCWLWDSIVNCPEQFLYWMRTPALPKGE